MCIAPRRVSDLATVPLYRRQKTVKGYWPRKSYVLTVLQEDTELPNVKVNEDVRFVKTDTTPQFVIKSTYPTIPE